MEQMGNEWHEFVGQIQVEENKEMKTVCFDFARSPHPDCNIFSLSFAIQEANN